MRALRWSIMPDERTHEIRAARATDSHQLHRLITKHAVFERAKASLSVNQLERLLEAGDQPAMILVAAEKHELIGYAALTFDFSLWRARRWAHLDCLFVEEQHRGKSVGRDLLEEVRRAARNAGADRLEGQTPHWNEPGIAFYVREGATVAQKARFYFDISTGIPSQSPAGSSRLSKLPTT